MLTLGIESSCDETAAAVVRNGREVLANVIASQDDLHAEYGGVVPEIASREHVQRIVPVIRRAMGEAELDFDDLDAIAVTSHPGLIGSLLVGVSAAKALAWSLGKPLVGVDHVRAHLYAGALDQAEPRFPAIGLVVSGGHTAIYHLNSWMDMQQLGTTIDDAVGEAYDKVAAMLGLPYPGGAKLDGLAALGDASAHSFPVSLLKPDSLDFSFSGVKTAVLYTIKGIPVRENGRTIFERDHTDLTESAKADIAASFQKAAIDALLVKLSRALEQTGSDTLGNCASYQSLLVGGGVSANSHLRARLPDLADSFDLELRLPKMRYCMDNAAMIAGLGSVQFAAGHRDDLVLQAAPTAPRRS
jgi:tRNA N6-adenosine threonylcarbamoyltransferase